MPIEKNKPAREISRLISRLQHRTFRTASRQTKMSASRYMALQYYGCANGYSRTVSALALYQGTAVSSASVLTDKLVKEGYLLRQIPESDRRTVKLHVSAQGKRILRADLFHEMTDAAESLPDRIQQVLLSGLAHIVARMSERLGQRQFGICKNCRYFKNGKGRICEFINVVIPVKDSEMLCVNFQTDVRKPR